MNWKFVPAGYNSRIKSALLVISDAESGAKGWGAVCFVLPKGSMDSICSVDMVFSCIFLMIWERTIKRFGQMRQEYQVVKAEEPHYSRGHGIYSTRPPPRAQAYRLSLGSSWTVTRIGENMHAACYFGMG